MPSQPPSQQELLERALPSNEESERTILGAVILDNDLIAQCVEELQEEDFYSPVNRRIFAAMVRLFNSSTQIDPITIGAELEKEGSIASIDISSITRLAIGLPRFSNLDEYIRIVRSRALSRRVIRMSNNFFTMAQSGEHEGPELLERCEDQLYALSNGNARSGFSRVQELVDSSVERSRLTAETGQTVIGLPTGYTDLDNLTLGLHSTELTVLAARPSMGKTALALGICQNVAFRGHGVVALFSLEMSEEQLAERIVCAEANLDSHAYKTGRLDDEEWERVTTSQQLISESRLFIDDTPAVGISYIRAKLRRLVHEQRQLDLVAVDFLQLMTGKAENREREVHQIAVDLKNLAKEFEIPVLATCQLNRAAETRAGHLPTMGDVRESGGIEQSADTLLALFRADYYNQLSPETHTNIAQVLILKQRNGPTGSVSLQFNGPSASFRNLTTQF